MSVKLRTKNKRLYLDIYHNGTRKWEALKISLSDDRETNKEIMKIAEICRAKRELQILSGAWGVTDPVGGNISLMSYIKKIQSKSKKAIKNKISNTLNYLLKFPGGGLIQLKQINSAWMLNFQNYLKNECKLKPSTAGTYESIVRQAIKQAVKENIISYDTTIGIKKIKPNESDKVFLNADEIQKLASIEFINECSKTVKRAFLFACNTGLRISDLITLKWENIEYKPLQIIKRQEKTERKVFIPLNDTAWKLINDLKIHNYNENVFPNLKYANGLLILKNWAKKAGIEKNIGWHTARHTFAVLSLESGADLYILIADREHQNMEWGVIEQTFNIKRGTLRRLASINGNMYKQDDPEWKAKDFEKILKIIEQISTV